METLYKLLKILIVILAVAVIAAAVWRFTPAPAEHVVSAETQSASNAAPDFTAYDLDGNKYSKIPSDEVKIGTTADYIKLI
jgi:flagellar basal body-associated protein FliL